MRFQMRLTFVVFFFVQLVSNSSQDKDTCKEEMNFNGKTSEQILYMLTDPCRYDRWKRPSIDGEPTQVSVRIYIYFIGNVEAQHLQYTTHVLMRYRWVDYRLARNVTYSIQGETLVKEKLWTPHMYIVNEYESRVMGSGNQDILVTVMPDGTVLYSTRLKVTLLCLMNLRKFPFDEQECPLVLESWTYNTNELLLSWEKLSPVVQNSRLHMTEYNLASIWTNSTFVMYSLPLDTWTTSEENYHYFGKFAGNYSSLTVYFKLEREAGHYLMDYYVPSILLVVVSWVTFWLDPNAVPGRTTLGTSTMLTFITLSRNTGSSLPKVSYIKATEIWFIGCTIFIFGSLVEFAFVNTIWRRRKDIELKKVTSKHVLRATLTPQLNRKSLSSSTQSLPSIQTIHENSLRNKYSNALLVPSNDTIFTEPAASCNSININSSNSQGFFKMTPQQIAGWIDKRSRVFFPIAFLIFNIFYWIFVLI
ncbi:pH-sensitive chloride channel 2-like isoform X2 [Planococcus citri]|uniref:pH-sensitive chloride channel 2-like isoform X2 n=1 Tax=Planococcus citri TaxID=170843 RepID=UPI0031F93D1E